jgi:predicted  nucleic acid-binding Zn-ribbon protein
MPKKNNDTGKQTVEELTQRYHGLNERKIQAETNLKNAQKQLDELRKQAKKEYGTENLDELKKKLDAMKEENETKRSKYQADLDKIEADLAEVEAKHGVGEEAQPQEEA